MKKKAKKKKKKKKQGSVSKCFDSVWSDLVLWHINHFWLFNAESCFYIYIKFVICK